MIKPKSSIHYLQIYATVYESLAWRTLPDPALRLWVDLRVTYRGKNNGSISATMSVLARRGWTSNDKLKRARDELIARGLLVCTRYCGPNTFHRASLYAFTDVDTERNEALGIAGARATRAFLQWSPPEIAKKHVHRQTVRYGTARR